MRARMALRFSKVKTELREVILKNKPEALLLASSKATVPVLICSDDSVIDESLDIMLWALQQHNAHDWLQPEQLTKIHALINHNDNLFKTHLDHYKYADRFPLHSQQHYRQKGEEFLTLLERQLEQHQFLVSDHVSLADIAIFPFIRQFAYVDIEWFETAAYPGLQGWLNFWLKSDLFLSVMHKHPAWNETQTTVYL